MLQRRYLHMLPHPSSSSSSSSSSSPATPQKLLDHLIQSFRLDRNLHDALHTLFFAHHSIPSSKSYTSLLNLHPRNLPLTRLVYIYFSLHHPHLDLVLCESLLLSLAKCGAIEDALYLLRNLSHRSAFCWTAIISAQTDSGNPSEALQTYGCMLGDGVQPDLYTFVALFKACGSIPDLERGRSIHADAETMGYTSDAFVASSLVSMYGKCRCIDEAEKVFIGMPQRDVASWSAMLSAHVEGGLGSRAIRLCRQILDIHPRSFEPISVLALKACGCYAQETHNFPQAKVVALQIGHALHSQSRRMASFSSGVLGSALVSMYGKCSTILDAENVFFQLSQHDIVSWNSMLFAYVENGLAIKALLLYKKMHDVGMIVSKQTFTIALRACQIIASGLDTNQVFSLALAFCCDITKRDFLSDVSIGALLISLFGDCGRVMEAENVFERLHKHDLVSCNEMISAYIEHGQPGKALQVYGRMQNNGIIPDQHIFAITIQACTALQETEDMILPFLEIGQALHAEVKSCYFISNVYIMSALLIMYGKCGCMKEAENLFASIMTHNVVSWTAMLSVYLEQEQDIKVLQLYYEMQKQGISPDERSIIIAFQACAQIGDTRETAELMKASCEKSMALEIGKALHADADRMRFTSDILVVKAMSIMYISCGVIAEAEILFNTVSQHNVILVTGILSAYAEHGHVHKALRLYMHERNSIIVDEVVAICVLKACSSTGSLETCNQIHFDVISTELSLNLMLRNTVIHTYGCCASMRDAQSVMDEIPHPDLVSWNACVGGYGHDGNDTMILQTFESMELMGEEPEEVTFLSVLSSFSHTGLIEKGIKCFQLMWKEYGFIPDKKHYIAIIDLFGRAGNLDRLKIICSQIGNSDVFSWICLLSACVKHGNVELGKQTFDYVMCLQSDEAVAYILMSNAYAYRIE